MIGKGNIQTFFVNVDGNEGPLSSSISSPAAPNLDVGKPPCHDTGKKHRLVEWTVEVLSGILKEVLARRSITSEDREEAKQEMPEPGEKESQPPKQQLQ